MADARCRTLEQRIAQLESKISKLTATPPVPAQPKAECVPARAIDGVITLSATQIDDILSFPYYYREANGWIYYIKVLKQGYSGYGELYKVRPDGTQNQKISSERESISSANTDPMFSSLGAFHVKGDKLQFIDANGNKRVIRV